MYHGILIEQQFTNPEILKKFKVNAIKHDGDWGIYCIEVEDQNIRKTIEIVQTATKEGTWYSHFYNDEKMIVVFREKLFEVTPHKSSWTPIVSYGKTLGIPEHQLDFWPNRFQDESHYFEETDLVK